MPPTVPVLRSKGVQNPRTSSTVRWRLEWAARRGLPVEVVMARADRAPRVALRDWARPPYDVVWFSTARSYEWLGRPDLGPTIVDLDNLEDVKARLRAELLADQLRSSGKRELCTETLSLVSGQAQRQRLATIPAVGGGSGGAGSDRQRPGRRPVRAVQRHRDPQHVPTASSGRSGTRPPAGRRSCSSRETSATHRTSTRRNGWRRPSPP